MKLSTVLILFIFILFSCETKDNKKMVEIWKEEVIKTETEFCNLSKKEGMNVAFMKYVADDGVLLRNNRLIKGKNSIKQFMINNTSKGLSWKPDFVDVSLSGDLAYTYGKYTYVYKDSSHNTKISKGIFHTVWKRQPDNTWKFVWD
ncbi:YybH family protein [Seonamhaeicola aphaedonensis]|nr:nuclear transport factor 2 family protein [Seonamhaeicola aphaedonensis]